MLGFEWGSSTIFADYRCFLKTVQAKYTLFKPDGTPIRATCQITLEEIPEEPKGQNPTSGSRESRRSLVLDAADSLAAVAYREYGNAALWRGIAAFNEIDDPLRVASGTRILVPSRGEAMRLADGEG
jgi:nucleoid-associated protein YgaU